MSQFAAALQNEVDIDSLTHDLLGVVQETMEPKKLSLWLIDQQRTKK